MSNHIEAVHDSSLTDNWIHLYADGIIKLDTRFATFGRVACKREEEWIVGLNCYLGLYSVFYVELWGVLNGLILIHGRGYKKAMIHTDNLKVVKTIQDVHLAYSSSALLRRIHMSLQAIQH